MKIVQRLILLILIGFVGCVAIAGISYKRLNELHNDMQNVMTNTLPSLNILNSANVHFLELRILMRAHALSSNPTEKQALDSKIADKEAKVRSDFASYNQYISDDTDRGLFEKAKSAMEDYFQQSQITLNFSRKNDTQNAIAELAKLATVAESVSTSIADDVAYNEKLAKVAHERDSANYEAAVWILILSTLITVGVLAVIGFMIYRQVHNGLASAQQTIGRIQSSLDFTLRADVRGNDEISSMLRTFNSFVQHLQSSLKEILSGVEQVSVTANHLQNSAERVSEGSNSQNASTSHMAASVEEMTVSINHVADQAKITSEQSNEVGRKAEAGQDVISKTVNNIHAISDAVESAAEDIRQLDEKSREIENVINIISSVAEQTNLLALNAAIEAARAGEQGRGFAVVADEVRSLAARTATSTKEISDMVTAIQTVSSSAVKRMEEASMKVEQGVEGAGAANETMQEIVSVASQSLELVADISTAIREQGAATNSIAQQVENVAQMVEENSHAARETSEQANRLAMVSDGMKKIVTAYRL